MTYLLIASLIILIVALIPVAYFAGTAYFVSKSLCKDMESRNEDQS